MGNRKKILVIDDSTFLCKILKGTLDAAGFETVTHGSMRDGAAWLKTAVPEIIFLDINLPDVEGDLGCKIIKQVPRCQHVPVVLISGSEEEIIQKKVRSCGAQGYLKKPFSPSSILRWISKNTHILAESESSPSVDTALPAFETLPGEAATPPALPGPAPVPVAERPALPGPAPVPVAERPALPGPAPVPVAERPALPGPAPVPVAERLDLPVPSPVPVFESLDAEPDLVVSPALEALEASMNRASAPPDAPSSSISPFDLPEMEAPDPVLASVPFVEKDELDLSAFKLDENMDVSEPEELGAGETDEVPRPMDTPIETALEPLRGEDLARVMVSRIAGAPMLETAPDIDILLVDDSRFLRSVLEDTMIKAGYRVRTADCIRRSIPILERGLPHLLLLDINLPDLSGDDACMLFKNVPRTKGMRIALISGGNEDSIRQKVEASQADAYLVKPFTPVSILEWLEREKAKLFPPSFELLPFDRPVAEPLEFGPPVPFGSDDPEIAPIDELTASLSVDLEKPPAVDLMIRQLESESAEVRMNACYSLGEMRCVEAAKGIILCLADKEEAVRSDAAWALGEIGSIEALRPLLARLEDEEGLTQQRVIEALGKLGHRKAVEPLIRCLSSPAKDVRLEAVKALGHIDDSLAVRALRLMTKDGDAEISANALFALEQLEKV